MGSATAIPHRTNPAADADVDRATSEPWGVFHWFAYFDPIDGVARAVCGSLGFCIIRDDVRDAIDELLIQMQSYVMEDGWSPQTDPEDLKRRIPSEAWEVHVDRYCKAQTEYKNERGSRWECGEFVVSSLGDITPAQA